jgi:hypothetical protein
MAGTFSIREKKRLYSEKHNGRNYLEEIDLNGRIPLSQKLI